MLKSTKILFGIFFVLLLIVFAEVGFYIFNQQKNPVYVSPSISPIKKYSSPSAETKDPPIITITPTSENFYKNLLGSFSNYLNNLGELADKKMLKGVVVTEEYEGIVADIKKEPGNLTSNSLNTPLKYDVSLILEDLNGQSKQETFYFTNEDIASAKISQIVNDQKKDITLQDLKPGDQIILEQTSNMLSDPRDGLLWLEIVKIN